ncbi:tricorn protease [Actinorhabdospora filicis]|uniref:Tricorn protease homolog n=1 Tax=Actinorhabdospora filicis TaxID=1785913 RepID=A0A9W6SJC8_9ACTN|nr:S41 family peptidase [Actinorhabdospora filicis]GLZ75716.1 tricorn protease [Actinorhabdospora filicis]
MANGYPRFPTIHGDTIVFVCEDDLWSVPSGGGTARRLTAGVGAADHPRVSPDGSLIAYSGREEGPTEVHVVPIEGGESRRLTFEGGARKSVTAWTPDGAGVVYSTNAFSDNYEPRLRSVPAGGGESAELLWVRGTEIAHGEGGVTVICRGYGRDAAHWKRYKGGTAGTLWIDATGSGEFALLPSLGSSVANPQIIGERLYFISDHEGYGNVYSVAFDGTDLARHTDHDDFYARHLSGDGHRLVYHCGGELYLLDPAEDAPRKLDVTIGVTRTQRARRFVDTGEFLHTVELSGDGSRLAITSRGKPFSFGGWEGAVVQHGAPDGVRYRHLTWLPGEDDLVAVAADTGETETLVTLPADGGPERRLSGLDLGRVAELAVSPKRRHVAVANHRNQILLVDLSEEQPVVRVVDTSSYGQITGPVFSPDGDWLAYASPAQASQADSASRTEIRLAEVATGATHVAAERVLRDEGPSFDPDGKFLYFVGHREYNPVYDELHFDLGFPAGSRPYAVVLKADTAAPFRPSPKPLVEDNGKDGKGTGAAEDESTKDDEAAAPEVSLVDVEGLSGRVVPVPVPAGSYERVLGAPGKVLVLSRPVQHTLPYGSDEGPHGVLDMVDLTTGKVERVADAVSWAGSGPDGKTMMYGSGDRLRVLKAGEKAPEETGTTRESGWIDLSRVKVSVRPEAEWPQMFREAWRLMSEHFWNPEMSGVDWPGVYERYSPLVHRVSTRAELSDLFWEMNGELGTSHAYERAGEDRPGPYYGQGRLGVEFDVTDGVYTFAKILRGDTWNAAATSPLTLPGVGVEEGDVLLAVNGQPVGGETGVTPGQRLVNQAGQEVALTVKRGDGEPRTVTVTALSGEGPLRYREWVEANRRRVHEATGGRIGYLHVPDMAPQGFAEFHRGFLAEHDRDGLIVDIRFNGGGHVSALLIEKLARRRIGYDYSRWTTVEPYPVESPRGPMVAIANELAGSDGDIFAHAFKVYGLGPLVGTRTWGGVVGYTDREGLSDNTFLSQPELSFHFDDGGWGVENHGVDPDVEVHQSPQDCAAGRDPQLETAIELALVEVEKRPGDIPSPTDRPVLTPPPLPPRPQNR